MAGGSSLVAHLLEFLNIHCSIGCGRHFDKMTQQSRHVKTGKTRLGYCADLELGNLLARSFVTKLFGYARAIWALRFFERFLACRRGKPINFYACCSIMELGYNSDPLRPTSRIEIETDEL